MTSSSPSPSPSPLPSPSPSPSQKHKHKPTKSKERSRGQRSVVYVTLQSSFPSSLSVLPTPSSLNCDRLLTIMYVNFPPCYPPFFHRTPEVYRSASEAFKKGTFIKRSDVDNGYVYVVDYEKATKIRVNGRDFFFEGAYVLALLLLFFFYSWFIYAIISSALLHLS